MNPGKSIGACGQTKWIIALYALTFFASISSLRAATNSWITSANGAWEDVASWSLGILPDSSQSVTITNSGEKIVTLNLATAQNFPASLTVSDLAVAGTNTLLVDNIGTNLPLEILSGLRVGPDGKIVQIGGSVRSGGVVMLNNGSYHMTNGIFKAGGILFVYPAIFDQHGGSANITSLILHEGSYNLVGGDLTVGDDIGIYGQYGQATFSQQGGTNRAVSLVVSGVGGAPVSYFMDGGLLCTSNVFVGPRGSLAQNGIHIVTNALQLQGTGRYFPPQPIPATYSNNGLLTARSIEINEFSIFTSSGTTAIEESLQFIGTPSYVGKIFLSGTLTCSDVLSSGAAVDIEQSGGTFIVTNLLSFWGYYAGGYFASGARYAQYSFSGGTLTASNIDLAAEWIIGSTTQAGRITNPGYFKMAGTLTVGDANEQLGRFILASNAIIDLGDGYARLSFANSSDETWNSSAILMITNWNGFATGGNDDKLKFGTDQLGLTSTQVSQIRFIDPLGFQTGLYNAEILNTGEVVPSQRPILTRSLQGSSFVLSWDDADFVLQTSTNILGPYIDIPDAVSPHTNEISGNPQRYFRLWK